ARSSIAQTTGWSRPAAARRCATYAGTGVLSVGQAPLLDVPGQPAEGMAVRALHSLTDGFDVGAVVQVDDRQVLRDLVHEVAIQRLALFLIQRAVRIVEPLVDLRIPIARRVVALTAIAFVGNLTRVERRRQRAARIDTRREAVVRNVEIAALDEAIV